MWNANGHKNFTGSGDRNAEALLKRVLEDINGTLSGSGLCVFLGGSYGRGDGGVRQDQENGILYNDLDFFVFARKKCDNAEELLETIAQKYEKELKVDVDFSRIMSVSDIKNNAKRLMMQELKRGYRLVAGEDLLAEYLPEIPAEKLPYSEACRLLLNRGMGLLLAGEKIANGSADMDFILRNINKAILGACDAFLIAGKKYEWKIDERLTVINASDLSADCKKLYAQAVEFKKSPKRETAQDVPALWSAVRDIFVECAENVCGDKCIDTYDKCRKHGEISLKNFIKYCIKSRLLPLKNWQYYTMPAVAVLANEVYGELANMQEKSISQSKLFRQWQIFN